MNFKFRPFAVLGLTLLTSLFAILYFNYQLSVFFIAIGLLLLLISFMFKSVREKLVPLYVAGALIVAGVSSYCVYNDTHNLSSRYVDKTVNIEGIITGEPDYSNFRYYYIVDLDKIDGQSVDSKLRLSLSYKIDAKPFDSISMDATIYKIGSQSRDAQNYYYSKGVFLGAYTLNEDESSVKVYKSNTSGFAHTIYLIRERLISNIMQKLPNEYGSTVVGMLLGDKSGLSDSRNESFREAGVAPIFAVSGMHLSVWVLGLHSILDKLKLKRKINSIIAIAFTVIFMFLAGLSPSVCRAGLMMIMLFSANLFYRKSDSLNSLGFVAFALCTVNPYTAIDSGFLLSFTATLGIVTLLPIADKYIFRNIPENFVGNSLKGMLSAITVGLSASIGVLPVTILLIGRISVYSVFSNLLLSPIATVCMITGGFSAIIYPISFLSDFFALISGLLARFMLTVIDFICNTSITSISVDNLFWKSGAICSVCLLIFAVITFKGKNLFKTIIIGLSIIFTIFGLSSYYYFIDLTQISILNVGNGISAVVNDSDEKIVLTGKADDYLKPMKINSKLEQISTDTPELIIFSENEAAYDPINLNLIKSGEYKTVILPESNRDVQLLTPNTDVIESTYITAGVLDSDNVRVNVQKEYSVAYCNFNDTTVLMLFDSKKNVNIPQEYLKADYLVCCSYIPECIQPQNYENVIVCGEKEKSATVCDYINRCGGNPILADDYDEIVINVREGKNKLVLWEE